jgi:hypothetical protein
MELYNSSSDYLYNLHTASKADSRRMWRQSIKDKWNNKCAYCGSTETPTIDHIVPQCKGGSDFLTNVVCCCSSCNNSKAHADWEIWYYNQDFFTEERMNAIVNWMKPKSNPNLYKYKPRRNNAS